MRGPQQHHHVGKLAACRTLLAGAVALSTLLAGCAQFPDERPSAESWRDKPELTPQAGPQPPLPGNPGAPGQQPGRGRPGQPPTSVQPPKGCKDFDPAVIATCLNPVSAIVALPTGDAAYAAERGTGRILRVQKDVDPVQIAVLPVDTTGGGGLTGLSLSPNFAEDGLLYAYLTTPTDNRVVRIAPGDAPKPVLTGIPRGGSGNRGVLALDRKGALLVATGNAGNPAAANDPNSLAGKILRIDGAGKPAQDNPKPGSSIVAAGLHAPGGMCGTLDGSAIWVTDQPGGKDVMYRVQPGQPLDVAAWTWPDRPGVAGCVAWPDVVVVATTKGAALHNLFLNRDGSFRGAPVITAQNAYGQFSGLDLGPNDLALAGTVNKDGGKPVSSDDRVVVFPHPSGGDGSAD